MGAGVSTAGGELEELVACTCLLGQALASMSFPDMYRIQDFHSPNAPRLSASSRWGRQEEPQATSGPVFNYSTVFNVMVGGERIVVDDVTTVNLDGWTPAHTASSERPHSVRDLCLTVKNKFKTLDKCRPLHASCHSHATVAAALSIVEELRRVGGDLDCKTRRGPGAYNSGWTPLHMACAYGIEPVVLALLEAGANPRCQNSLGWTPLLEACHRGFVSIVKLLLDNTRKPSDLA